MYSVALLCESWMGLPSLREWHAVNRNWLQFWPLPASAVGSERLEGGWPLHPERNSVFQKRADTRVVVSPTGHSLSAKKGFQGILIQVLCEYTLDPRDREAMSDQIHYSFYCKAINSSEATLHAGSENVLPVKLIPVLVSLAICDFSISFFICSFCFHISSFSSAWLLLWSLLIHPSSLPPRLFSTSNLSL